MKAEQDIPRKNQEQRSPYCVDSAKAPILFRLLEYRSWHNEKLKRQPYLQDCHLCQSRIHALWVP